MAVPGHAVAAFLLLVHRTLEISCERPICSALVSFISLLGRSLALRVLRRPGLPVRVRLSNVEWPLRMVLPVCTGPPQVSGTDLRIELR